MNVFTGSAESGEHRLHCIKEGFKCRIGAGPMEVGA